MKKLSALLPLALLALGTTPACSSDEETPRTEPKVQKTDSSVPARVEETPEEIRNREIESVRVALVNIEGINPVSRYSSAQQKVGAAHEELKRLTPLIEERWQEEKARQALSHIPDPNITEAAKKVPSYASRRCDDKLNGHTPRALITPNGTLIFSDGGTKEIFKADSIEAQKSAHCQLTAAILAANLCSNPDWTGGEDSMSTCVAYTGPGGFDSSQNFPGGSVGVVAQIVWDNCMWGNAAYAPGSDKRNNLGAMTVTESEIASLSGYYVVKQGNGTQKGNLVNGEFVGETEKTEKTAEKTTVIKGEINADGEVAKGTITTNYTSGPVKKVVETIGEEGSYTAVYTYKDGSTFETTEKGDNPQGKLSLNTSTTLEGKFKLEGGKPIPVGKIKAVYPTERYSVEFTTDEHGEPDYTQPVTVNYDESGETEFQSRGGAIESWAAPSTSEDAWYKLTIVDLEKYEWTSKKIEGVYPGSGYIVESELANFSGRAKYKITDSATVDVLLTDGRPTETENSITWSTGDSFKGSLNKDLSPYRGSFKSNKTYKVRGEAHAVETDDITFEEQFTQGILTYGDKEYAVWQASWDPEKYRANVEILETGIEGPIPIEPEVTETDAKPADPEEKTNEDTGESLSESTGSQGFTLEKAWELAKTAIGTLGRGALLASGLYIVLFAIASALFGANHYSLTLMKNLITSSPQLSKDKKSKFLLRNLNATYPFTKKFLLFLAVRIPGGGIESRIEDVEHPIPSSTP